MSPDGQTSSRNDGADNAKDESRRKEWESYRETLEREDYDSSDYYYSSTDDDDDHLVFDPDEFSDSDDSSRSSDDGRCHAHLPSQGALDDGDCDENVGVNIRCTYSSKSLLPSIATCRDDFSRRWDLMRYTDVV
ncbi:hypothetical protein BGX31_002328 [Mortierella sp. GBA43]|nr:hypothetical protein BGX31_002328 [Mortierella sp. GBA43]